MTWTHEEAVALCRQVESICPEFGCHVALAGGCLYKDGPRKDLDLVFYRIRQAPKIDVAGLCAALHRVGIVLEATGNWFVLKARTVDGQRIDCLFPEMRGDYTATMVNLGAEEKAKLTVEALGRAEVQERWQS